MAYPFRHLILVFLAWSGLAAPPAERAVRFTVFSAQAIEGVVFAPSAEGARRPLVFYPTARSPQYEHRGEGPIRFFEALSGEGVAEAFVPPVMQDALLLFTPIRPAPASGPRYRVAVLDDGIGAGAGGLFILNLSGLALSGTVDGKPSELRAGLNAPLVVGRSVRIGLQSVYKGRRYEAYAEVLAIKKDERALLILFPPFYEGSLEVQSRVLIGKAPAGAKEILR